MCVVNSSYAQKVTFAKGEVIDSVAVLNSQDTYALYLPKQFSQKEPAAIIFIFDPGARGTRGLTPFIEAAEKYNYILVCSNTSRNGPIEDNFKAANELLASVLATFRIDEAQIYTAGFSGGSRFAATIAILTEKIEGVIACGAGMFSNAWQIPSMQKKFSYVGLVGDSDMNFQEMLAIQSLFRKLQIDTEILTFKGGHKWPAPQDIVRALDWLELQAYKKGIRTINDSMLKASLHRNYELGLDLENNQEVDLAVLEYERILRNYKPHYNLDSITTKVQSIKKGKDYKTKIKKATQIKIQEAKFNNTIMERFSAELSGSNNAYDFNWWEKEFVKLRKKYVLSDDPDLKKMGARVESSIHAIAYESGAEALRKYNMKKAIYCHRLLSTLKPDAAYPYYLLAKDYALLNDLDAVIANLQLAAANGFTNKDAIKNTKEFLKYNETKAFKLFLERI